LSEATADGQSIAGVIAASNYFQAEGTSLSATVVEKQLAELDTLVELLEPEDVKELKEQVEKAGNGQNAKNVLAAKAKGLGEKAEGKFVEFA
jgi:DnaJ family protein C protein 2